MSDTVEIELDPAPSAPPVALPPVYERALAAMARASSTTDLERAIAPLRALPESPHKARARIALRAAEARLKAPSQPTPAQTPRVGGAAVTPGPAPTSNLPAVEAAIDAAIAKARAAVHVAAETSAPTGPILHDGDTDSAVAAIKAHAARARIPTVTAPTQTAAEVRGQVRAREVVVGATEAGSGVLLGWSGRGEVRRADLEGVLSAAGCPVDWAPPVRSHHAHAAAALTSLTSQGRVVRAERGRKVRDTVIYRGVPRIYAARWTVGDPTHGAVGDTFGLTVLTVGLTQTGVLDVDGEPGLCDRVRAEYDRLVGGEVYPAGEVTDWLRGVLVRRFGAVRLGLGYYVPRDTAGAAERLCAELAKIWGLDWIVPALPVATTDQLRAGLVRGLAAEADAVVAELETQRETARRDREGGDIGPKAAATLLAKLYDVQERAKGYALVLGDTFTRPVRDAVARAYASVEALCDASARRFALMDLR